uniref:Large ribosomal subunit protein uL22c n=1 Tax=Riquetophycus sp. TaxID=1897556 RepID=A0A1C9C8G2_9FLOR|nr:ribosomal protein L22 [Riquetophycus sp.]
MQQKLKESKAISKYARISTNKASRILDQIRGKKYVDARLMLEFMPYKACQTIRKTLESAASNHKVHDIDKNSLIVKEAFVNQGPKLKRFQPRAQGRAFSIHKPTCHITITIQSK